jgi:hypothetical protein
MDTPDTFHLFPLLPAELRLKIYSCAFTIPRIITLQLHDLSDTAETPPSPRCSMTHPKPHPLLSTCHESRALAKSRISMSPDCSDFFNRVNIDFERDSLHLSSFPSYPSGRDLLKHWNHLLAPPGSDHDGSESPEETTPRIDLSGTESLILEHNTTWCTSLQDLFHILPNVETVTLILEPNISIRVWNELHQLTGPARALCHEVSGHARFAGIEGLKLWGMFDDWYPYSTDDDRGLLSSAFRSMWYIRQSATVGYFLGMNVTEMTWLQRMETEFFLLEWDTAKALGLVQ